MDERNCYSSNCNAKYKNEAEYRGAIEAKKAAARAKEVEARVKEEEAKARVEIEKRLMQEELEKAKKAKEFGEFEYKVITIPNADGGAVDAGKLQKILDAMSEAGWRLITVYSNELGKTSRTSSMSGFGTSTTTGTNSTVCQDVMFFERRIR